MQSRKSSFALSIVKSAAVMFVLLSALGTFAGAATTYTENTIYSFGTNFPDGMQPLRNGFVMDKAGNLYGTTSFADCGLGQTCDGTVFELTPNGSGGWTETVLHYFNPLSNTNPNDGVYPAGSLAIDSKGNLYGTTTAGGANNTGVVWELSPPTVKGNPWAETILHSFAAAGSGDGYQPLAGVTLASPAATVLYGTTECGGSGTAIHGSACGSDGPGTVYQLTYVKKTKIVPAHWTETILHNFSGTDGTFPLGSLLLSGGNLYGYTYNGGLTGASGVNNGNGGGVVYELKPNGTASTLNVLYNFGTTANDAMVPLYGAPAMDSEKNLYGTGWGGGAYQYYGAVWELEYSATTKSYTEQVLYSFGANQYDVSPNWGLVYSKGRLFGATGGDPSGGGNVFELTYKKPTKKASGGWQETDLYDFPTTADGPGWNQLIMDSKGNLYGMLPGGADPDFGSVFELSPSTE